jgi:hypothetical protein
MDKVGQENINLDTIVDDVLYADGVLQFITIFSASMSASLNDLRIEIIESDTYHVI